MSGVGIKHPNTMVVVTNKAELFFIINWCEDQKILPPLLGEIGIYPIAVSPNGGGWTNHMDRALYYIIFKDFINTVT